MIPSPNPTHSSVSTPVPMHRPQWERGHRDHNPTAPFSKSFWRVYALSGTHQQQHMHESTSIPHLSGLFSQSETGGSVSPARRDGHRAAGGPATPRHKAGTPRHSRALSHPGAAAPPGFPPPQLPGAAEQPRSGALCVTGRGAHSRGPPEPPGSSYQLSSSNSNSDWVLSELQCRHHMAVPKSRAGSSALPP